MRYWNRSKPNGRGCLAPCRSRRPIWPWTSCSTAGCSTRPWPAGSGPAPPSIRREEPTVFAISCKTAWPWGSPLPGIPGNTCCGRRLASSWKGTCSTGGCRTPVRGCAPGSRMTGSGWHSPRPPMCAATPMTLFSRSRSPSWRAAPVGRISRMPSSCPRSARRSPPSMSTVPAAWIRPWRSPAAWGCRSWDRGTGTMA
ncbi:hypothetical protein D3C75_847360 [compost metagenome]